MSNTLEEAPTTITRLGQDLVRMEPGVVHHISDVKVSVKEDLINLFKAGEPFALKLMTESSQALGDKTPKEIIVMAPRAQGSAILLGKLISRVENDAVFAEEVYRGLNPIETYTEKFAKITL